MAKAQSTPAVKKATKAQIANAAKANLEAPTKDLHEISEEQKAADAEANKIVKNDAFSQFVNQGNGNALKTPDAVMEAFNRDLATLKAKHGVVAEVKVKPAKANKVQQNNVTRPAENTTCGKIWATADAISLATHGVCPIAALKEHADIKSINDHTVKTQYAKWRQFNGIVGRLPKLHAVHQVAGEYDGLKPIDQTAE